MPYKMLYNTAQALRPSQATKTCLLMELRKKKLYNFDPQIFGV